MKKYLFVFLSIILVSGSYAQEFKLIGGTGLSSYNVWPEVVTIPNGWGWMELNSISNYKTGFILGVGVEFDLTRNIAFEIDGLYFQKGSIIRERQLTASKWHYILNEVSFPIFIKIKLLPGSSPYILGGGELSIILSHKRKLILEEEEYETDIKDNTKSFDYGLVFGAGYEKEFPTISFFIEGRYHLGLRNITKEYWRFESIKTSAIVLLLGLKI